MEQSVLRSAHKRPWVVFVLAVITFGIYMPFWYHRVYKTMRELDGTTPTGNGFWLDAFLSLITCGIYAIWVDYELASQIQRVQQKYNLSPIPDTRITSLILDLAAYLTVFVTFFLTSAIHQEQINRVLERFASPVPQV